ncbi:DNA-binding protein [Pseudomonas sp. TCU-HL1]|uniref:DNA-binding protein n=1 Tax=Pseudomonas sp. TCU-HL1 TaxID=1856685 RepID=UPI00083DC7B3|nr:DNA-binding protein [Pseudomonas sp. TCU-HL1]AOE85935.1 hypothetical protein THL1_3387 [Pseudomonas sp. TCU-HL1]
MLRGGITKALVYQAQQALLARGARATINAVRAELGNVGSKSTIHRYLKELEDAPIQASPALRDELSGLIGTIADRLVEEAELRAAAERATLAHQARDHGAYRRRSEARIEKLRASNTSLSAQLLATQQTTEQLRELCQTGALERTRLEQRLRDQQELLDERAGRLASLETELERVHAAQSYSQQVSQDQYEHSRQHYETRIQGLQIELARLTRENERLRSESRSADTAVREEPPR